MTAQDSDFRQRLKPDEPDQPTQAPLDAPELEADQFGDLGLDDESTLDDEPLDEVDLTIQEYLDGELPEEERVAFEKKIADDPQLAERVRAAKSAFDVLDALDEQEDAVSDAIDLTERTVDRLSRETKT